VARQLGITIRARGSHNSRHPLTPYGGPQAFTPEVWSALQGARSIQRARRFLTATEHTKQSEAAAALGITGSNVIQLLNVLERRTNSQLLERKGKRRTLTLTPAGHAFSQAIRQALELLDHATPHKQPETPAPIQWLRGEPKHDHQNRRPTSESTRGPARSRTL
jgi:DNA-binding MarR family transcriptional regulator